MVNWSIIRLVLWLGVKRYTVWRYTAVHKPRFGSRYGADWKRYDNGSHPFLFERNILLQLTSHPFCLQISWLQQLCTIKIAVYLDVSDIQNTHLGQLCSLYCKASILKVFKDLSTGYVVWSEEIRDFFSVQIYCPKVLIYFGWTIYMIAQWTS